MKSRDYAFDNIKFILIVLVVFGHFLEIANGYGVYNDVYRIIYSFHMPVFFFISGYFAKFNKRKVFNVFLLYFVFQILYISFSNLLFDTSLIYQIIVPYWLLWYLLVYFFYLCLLPLIDTKKEKFSIKGQYDQVITVIIISLVLYFVVPYFQVNDIFAISRFFTFLPYFVLGFYYKKIFGNNFDSIFKSQKNKNIVRLVFALLCIFAAIIIAFYDKINALVLYGSYSYVVGYGPFIRLILLYCSLCWIGFFMITLRVNRNIPLITRVGANTIGVYLLHGFVIRIVNYWGIFEVYKINAGIILIVSIILVLLLGNVNFKYCGKRTLLKENDYGR